VTAISAELKADRWTYLRIIKNSNQDSIFYIYPDQLHIEKDYLDAARKANCVFISIGVETMDDAVLKIINRKVGIERIKSNISLFASMVFLQD